jgi:hypothetical protein
MSKVKNNPRKQKASPASAQGKPAAQSKAPVHDRAGQHQGAGTRDRAALLDDRAYSDEAMMTADSETHLPSHKREKRFGHN